MTRLNVSFAPHDKVLQKTLEKIHDPTIVDSHHANDGRDAASLVVNRVGGVVENVVKNPLAFNAPAGRFMLDLIGHANSKGVLQFGKWEINSLEENSEQLRRHWEELKIKPKAIRLLGCNTGLFEEGQKAIQHLSSVFRDVEIYGATGILKASDFESGGLSEESEKGLLRKPGQLPRFQDPASVETAKLQFGMMAPAPSIENIFDRLRSETLDEATYDARSTLPQYQWKLSCFAAEKQHDLFRHLDPGLATAPGLLTVPEFEALYSVENSLEGPRFHRATILLGGWFVRIYPIGIPEGVILRSQDVLHLDGGKPVELPPAAITTSPTYRI